MIDLNELVVFHQIVEQNSLTKAADKLGMPRSSISRKLRHLEEQLGVRLIQRTTRSLQLTEIGQIYYEHCIDLVRAAEEAQLAVDNSQSEPAGRLRITAPASFVPEAIVGQVISDFVQQHPKIDIDLVLTNDVINLVDERFDAAFRVGPLTDSSYIARNCGQVYPLLVASPDYLKRKGTPETIDDLPSCDTINFEGFPWRWEDEDGGKTLELTHRFNVNHLNFAMRFVLEGLGIGILPLPLCVGQIAAGDLVPILPKNRLEPVAVYVVYPERKQMPLKLKVFLDHVQTVARQVIAAEDVSAFLERNS